MDNFRKQHDDVGPQLAKTEICAFRSYAADKADGLASFLTQDSSIGGLIKLDPCIPAIPKRMMIMLIYQ